MGGGNGGGGRPWSIGECRPSGVAQVGKLVHGKWLEKEKLRDERNEDGTGYDGTRDDGAIGVGPGVVGVVK